MRLLSILVTALLCSGCVSLSTQKLPAHAIAMDMGGPENVAAYFEEEVGTDDLEGAVPFALVTGASVDYGREGIARNIAGRARELEPDFVLISGAESYYAGSVGAYLGFGVTSSTAQYGSRVVGICFRACDAILGIQFDRGRLVTRISDGSNARDAGLLEGDTILSINGAAIDEDTLMSQHYKELLLLQPGDNAHVVWVRPGVGRMSADIVAIENPRRWEAYEPTIIRAPRRDNTEDLRAVGQY